MTLPVESLPRPDGFYRALINVTDERSRQYAEWPQVRWHVDARPATARTWRFADGWVTVSDAAPGVYLAAVGVGIEPDDLPLAVLENGDAYHFNLDQPMHPKVMAASHAARTDDDRPPRLRTDWHADQLRLMRQPEHGNAD